MVNSINTNISAQVALANLNVTNRDLEMVQKRVSTGFNVADAVDNGAAFAIAQGIRSDLAALGAVNSQLGNAKGLMSVANTAARSISDTLADLRDVATRLADDNVTGDQRTQYEAQYDELEATISTYIQNAEYNGTNILNGSVTGTDVNVIGDVSGGTLTINGYDLSGGDFLTMLDNSAITTAADWQTFLNDATADQFVSAENAIGTTMNALAADTKALDDRINFNVTLVDALEQGLGAIVDADLAKESAKLQALQTKQQLGVQALSIANAAPNVLLSLFRG